MTGAAMPFALAVEGNADADVQMSALVGKVRSANRDQVVVQTSTGAVSVVAVDGARMYSGGYGEIASTDAFIVGDRVGAMGRPTARGFMATTIGSVFTPLTATVTAVSADQSVAYTTAGPIQLNGGRLPAGPQSRSAGPEDPVTPGSVISGQSWTHPTTGAVYLLVHP